MLADTDTADGSSQEFYYPIRPVKGLNSTAQEWSVHFLTTKSQLLSLGEPGSMFVRSMSLPRFDSAVVEKTLGAVLAKQTPAGYGTITSAQPLILGAYSNEVRDTVAALYTATMTADSLRELKRLQTADTMPGWNSHPSTSPDNKLLFFASNRPGGYGGTDIWYMRRTKDGGWSMAYNAGPQINTACDELCPFMCPDSKTLLFASSGHDTYGGYDIFRCEISQSKKSSDALDLSPVINLGSPLNGPSDELFASTPSTSTELLYFSSNRKAGADFDIYVRKKEKTSVKDRNIVKKSVDIDSTRADDFVENDRDSITIRGRLFTVNRRVVVRGEVFARDVRRRRVVSRTISNDSGDYELRVPLLRDIEVVAQSDEGFYDSYRYTRSPRDTSRNIEHQFTVPEVMALRINFPENVSQEPYKNVLDSNGLETQQQWIESLDLVADNLKRSKDLIKRVILVGHTDENGTNEYNLGLGKRRVEFVVDELVKRGINRNLFQSRSAGEMEPLPRRKDEVLETYYKRNRRVELTKIMR